LTPAPSEAARPSPAAPRSPTFAEVERLRSVVEASPDDPDAQGDLGRALLQLGRETYDPTLYAAADEALQAADRLRPDDATTLVGIGALQLARHDFADALETGRRAVELAPGFAAAHGVVVDALVELGRYDEADDAAARMFAIDDDLGTLARVSYLRELRGDLTTARDAMAAAADRPGLAPENQAFALAILGNLGRWTGDPDAARSTWERALELVPGHPPSVAGLARLDIGEGRLDAAEERLLQIVEAVPLPEYVIALGDVQSAEGRGTKAKASFDLARFQIELFRRNGVAIDLELALFEADHGDPARALELAQAAWEATPTVRAADAVGWALHRLDRDADARAWSDGALHLGSSEPLLRYHAGAIAAALGDDDAAREDLSAALETDPGFSATGAAEAQRLLDGLDD
jgi:tetratricopeptide (TPR) repeat protein